MMAQFELVMLLHFSRVVGQPVFYRLVQPVSLLVTTKCTVRTMSSLSEIPKSMKAIRVEKNGGPEVNVLKEIPVPQPKDNEVLIKVEYTGVNFIDNYQRSGLYNRPLPYTVGQDAVGTIVALPFSAALPSTSLPTLKLGQRVLTPVGESFAEYLVAPVGKVAPLPDFVKPEDGPAYATTAFTAAALVKESYPIQKGDWVLVRAAAGGVGTLLSQLSKHLGASVIGTTSSPEKAKIAKENGADHVLLTTDSSESNVKKLLELTGGKGVHVVYDGVGKDTWEEDFEVIRPKGTIVTYGNASGPVPPFAPLKLSPKCLKVTRPTLGPFINDPQDFALYANFIFDTIKAGGLKSTTYKVYDFSAEGVAQAQTDITSRSTIGKLVIKVA
ncbi:hypothetical protein BCR39DRAFT_543276 [Naematelia encephala]|uniref:Probable quinone oxidoreductase n=1 Tax=Naematelia encephala TaxID=71784 RepID=A0A1Y2AT48_9TREE|nr:hypothetical protein BCR39DRAFT_543276 [Naematelia encephala]